jgi:methyl-accepting chemotaxis protein
MKIAQNSSPRQWGLALKLGLLMLVGTTLIFGCVFAYNYSNSRRLIFEKVQENARHLTLATLSRIESTLIAVEKQPLFMARLIEEDHPTREELLLMGRNAVLANPEIYGSIFAFEPHGYEKGKEYYAPYHYREGDKTKLVWFGSADYHYFNLDWYMIPRELNRPIWTEPYFDEGGTEKLISTFSVPFYRQVKGKKTFWGVVTADIELDWLARLVDSVKVLKTGYAFLISQNGVFVTNPMKDLVMRESIFDRAEEENDLELRRLGRDMVRGGEGFYRYYSRYLNKPCWMYYAPLHTTGWSLVVVFPEDELFADLHQLSRRVAGMGALGFAGLIFMALVMMRRLVKPIAWITNLADQMASGDLGGAMRNMETFERDTARLTTREYSRLARSFISMTRSLYALIGQVRQSGVQVTETSAEIAASARQLEVTAAEQAASTQEVSKTSRGISSRSQALVTTMKEVSAVAAHTAELAGRGRSGLENMEAGMQKLIQATSAISSRLSAISEKAVSIGSIVKTINKVADQTNLLSLNAGIEAEKAGEYGLGFSVVAREIRRLADQTAQATKDIRRMVDEMHGAVSSGVMEMDKFVEQVRQGGEDVSRINGQLGEIIGQVRCLTPQFDAINNDMQAQSAGAEQISEAMDQLSLAAGQIKDSLQEFNRVTQHLNGAAQGLAQEVARFRVDG